MDLAGIRDVSCVRRGTHVLFPFLRSGAALWASLSETLTDIMQFLIVVQFDLNTTGHLLSSARTTGETPLSELASSSSLSETTLFYFQSSPRTSGSFIAGTGPLATNSKRFSHAFNRDRSKARTAFSVAVSTSRRHDSLLASAIRPSK